MRVSKHVYKHVYENVHRCELPPQLQHVHIFWLLTFLILDSLEVGARGLKKKLIVETQTEYSTVAVKEALEEIVLEATSLEEIIFLENESGYSAEIAPNNVSFRIFRNDHNNMLKLTEMLENGEF